MMITRAGTGRLPGELVVLMLCAGMKVQVEKVLLKDKSLYR